MRSTAGCLDKCARWVIRIVLLLTNLQKLCPFLSCQNFQTWQLTSTKLKIFFSSLCVVVCALQRWSNATHSVMTVYIMLKIKRFYFTSHHTHYKCIYRAVTVEGNNVSPLQCRVLIHVHSEANKRWRSFCWSNCFSVMQRSRFRTVQFWSNNHLLFIYFHFRYPVLTRLSKMTET